MMRSMMQPDHFLPILLLIAILFRMICPNDRSRIKNNYFRRLEDKTRSIEMGFILSGLLGNFERISDHCSNIAVAVLEGRSGVKQNSEDDRCLFEEYSAEYPLKAAK